ncbi:hypothetical protein GF385_02180 [Candidatus Dependentiae bacterium]|nr:hypothetical protein [Candidatus Dependentiae bacterium]
MKRFLLLFFALGSFLNLAARGFEWENKTPDKIKVYFEGIKGDGTKVDKTIKIKPFSTYKAPELVEVYGLTATTKKKMGLWEYLKSWFKSDENIKIIKRKKVYSRRWEKGDTDMKNYSPDKKVLKVKMRIKNGKLCFKRKWTKEKSWNKCKNGNKISRRPM